MDVILFSLPRIPVTLTVREGSHKQGDDRPDGMFRFAQHDGLVCASSL